MFAIYQYWRRIGKVTIGLDPCFGLSFERRQRGRIEAAQPGPPRRALDEGRAEMRSALDEIVLDGPDGCWPPPSKRRSTPTSPS